MIKNITLPHRNLIIFSYLCIVKLVKFTKLLKFSKLTYSPPEHPWFDDNGDGVGNEYNTSGYAPNNPDKDGYIGKFYSLSGWINY